MGELADLGSATNGVWTRQQALAVTSRGRVEADGRAGHAGPQMAARDHRRDRLSDARGWRTERCTWFEVRCRQKALARRVLDAAAAQEARHPAA